MPDAPGRPPRPSWPDRRPAGRAAGRLGPVARPPTPGPAAGESTRRRACGSSPTGARAIRRARRGRSGSPRGCHGPFAVVGADGTALVDVAGRSVAFRYRCRPRTSTGPPGPAAHPGVGAARSHRPDAGRGPGRPRRGRGRRRDRRPARDARGDEDGARRRAPRAPGSFAKWRFERPTRSVAGSSSRSWSDRRPIGAVRSGANEGGRRDEVAAEDPPRAPRAPRRRAETRAAAQLGSDEYRAAARSSPRSRSGSPRSSDPPGPRRARTAM